MEELKNPYTRELRFRFHAAGTEWVATGWSRSHVYFEETRKNGQEDTHMGGCVCCTESGGWKYERDEYFEYDNINMQLGERAIGQLEEFFNTYGPPSEVADV